MIPDNKQEKNTASKTGSYSFDACGHASIYISKPLVSSRPDEGLNYKSFIEKNTLIQNLAGSDRSLAFDVNQSKGKNYSATTLTL